MISNSILIDNKKIRKDLKKYKTLRKNKVSIIAVILSTLAIAAFVFGGVLLFLRNYYGISIILLSLVVLSFASFFDTRNKRKNNELFLRKLEIKHNQYAKENDVLSIHPIFPLFLHADDINRKLTIYYQDIILVEALYDDFKNYKIYYNINYEAKQRIPNTLDKGIKYFSISMNFKNGENSTISLVNYCSNLTVNSKGNYLQFVNTKMINDLATILDQVLRVKNKSNN